MLKLMLKSRDQARNDVIRESTKDMDNASELRRHQSMYSVARGQQPSEQQQQYR